jgi:hypothetical protein
MLQNIVFQFLSRIARSKKIFMGKYLRSKYLLKSNRINGIKNITIKSGIKLLLLTNDFVDKYIYITGEYEPELESFLRDNLKEGDNFIDVGSNIGYFSILASRLIGSEGRVFSFEASPSMLIRLKENININGISNIQIVPKAVSNKQGKLDFLYIILITRACPL